MYLQSALYFLMQHIDAFQIHLTNGVTTGFSHIMVVHLITGLITCIFWLIKARLRSQEAPEILTFNSHAI